MSANTLTFVLYLKVYCPFLAYYQLSYYPNFGFLLCTVVLFWKILDFYFVLSYFNGKFWISTLNCRTFLQIFGFLLFTCQLYFFQTLAEATAPTGPTPSKRVELVTKLSDFAEFKPFVDIIQAGFMSVQDSVAAIQAQMSALKGMIGMQPSLEIRARTMWANVVTLGTASENLEKLLAALWNMYNEEKRNIFKKFMNAETRVKAIEADCRKALEKAIAAAATAQHASSEAASALSIARSAEQLSTTALGMGTGQDTRIKDISTEL
jgi:hypothetical protein